MYFEIAHAVRYSFSAPVRLGRYTLRLRPISDTNQHVHRFEMKVTPGPAGSSDLSDLDGNYAAAVWFEAPADLLVIETASLVETRRSNPLDYTWQGQTTLPVRYSAAFADALGPFLASMVPASVRVLGEEVAQAAGNDAEVFPVTLARMLRDRFSLVAGTGGEPLDAADTLQRGEGSGRDLAVLFMAAARSQGFAARFVSGYLAERAENEALEMHAWAELYIPGGGWRGFDPTAGAAVADRHVAVAAGALAEQAAPVSGTYTGGAASRLDTSVGISEVSSLP